MSKGTILVVEDETVTALDIQRSLRQQGYLVPDIACTGPEAISLARQSPPDLVLMDIRLRGDLDGIETAEQLRQELNTPVVFLTAYADNPTLQRAKRAEPFAYLLKPFDETVLATTIEIALHKHQAHQQGVQEILDALRQSNERFERLAQSISDYAIVLLDAAGRICSWNPGAEQLHGWGAGEVMGRDVAVLYPPEAVAQGQPQQDLDAAQRTARLTDYAPQWRKDGRRFPARTVLMTLRSSLGKLAGFLRITRPLSPDGEPN